MYQEWIAKIVLLYAKVLSNLLIFEAEGLIFIDSTFSSIDKNTLRELILRLQGLSEENKDEKFFCFSGERLSRKHYPHI